MNIAIFTDSFVPLINGITTSTISLAKGLADKNHHVYIIAPSYKSFKEFSYPGVTVKRLSSIPAFFYPGFRFTAPINLSLLNYLKKEKIDIIHFQTPSTLGMQAILISKLLKKPLVGEFHTFITDEQYLKHSGINLKPLQPVLWGFVRKYYDKCDLVICPSESTKKELIKHKFSKNIKVISNGIDLDSFDNSKYRKFSKKYKLNNKTILFIGRIAYEKNIDYLLECFKLVVKKIIDTKLLIVGNGPQMNELKKFSKHLGISKNVIFAGKIEHDKLLKSGIFKACKIFVTASTTETQGITILEAQANGIVCVGVNARGTKDLIKNNYNGYLVKEGNKKEFANRIVELFNNKELYNKMSKNVLKEVKKHDVENVIEEWERTYRRIKNEK